MPRADPIEVVRSLRELGGLRRVGSRYLPADRFLKSSSRWNQRAEGSLSAPGRDLHAHQAGAGRASAGAQTGLPGETQGRASQRVTDMSEDLCEFVRIARSMRTPVRQAFTLCKVYGLGSAQIAEQMSVPESMVADYLVEAVLHVASSTTIATGCDGGARTDSAGDHVGA